MCKQTVISDTDEGNGDADIAAPSAGFRLFLLERQGLFIKKEHWGFFFLKHYLSAWMERVWVAETRQMCEES